MIEKIVCGFQSGADQGGIRAASAAGLVTGGFIPRGFLTEDGPRPEFAGLYGAVEHKSDKYPPRTYANVHAAEATLWYGYGDSRGFDCTSKACERIGRPLWFVAHDRSPADVATLLGGFRYKSLNIAGTRESKAPGVGAWAERHFAEVLLRLAAGPEGPAA